MKWTPERLFPPSSSSGCCYDAGQERLRANFLHYPLRCPNLLCVSFVHQLKFNIDRKHGHVTTTISILPFPLLIFITLKYAVPFVDLKFIFNEMKSFANCMETNVKLHGDVACWQNGWLSRPTKLSAKITKTIGNNTNGVLLMKRINFHSKP